MFKDIKFPELRQTGSLFYKIAITVISVFPLGCKKDWLNAKPERSLVIPKDISDFQAMIDNSSSTTDFGFNVAQPALDEMSAGDLYFNDASLKSMDAFRRNAYIWGNQDFYQGKTGISDWNSAYKRIFNANIILEGLSQIANVRTSDQNSFNDVKGAALFFRAYDHYSIAQLFCKPYSSAAANKEMGIPLRLTADLNEISIRSNIIQTYNAVIADLKQSKEILPVELPNTLIYKNRPTKVAADAMLARVYLSMSNYDSALKYSSGCLDRYNKLMDFNNKVIINQTSTTPFPRFNDEVILQKTLINYGYSAAFVDSALYQSYSSNDLRKICFFKSSTNRYVFKGSYDMSSIPFSGLATDEMYLIRAECLARKGNLPDAMKDLNKLLKTRWLMVNGNTTYVDKTETDKDLAIRIILNERRKELFFRGLRWTDLRRNNLDPKYAVTLNRIYNNQTYTLAPNDTKYVLPIPDYVIQLSGIPNNPR